VHLRGTPLQGFSATGCYSWTLELRDPATNADKWYQVVHVDAPTDAVLIGYGRTGAAGRWIANPGSVNAAIEKTQAKVKRGYQITSKERVQFGNLPLPARLEYYSAFPEDAQRPDVVDGPTVVTTPTPAPPGFTPFESFSAQVATLTRTLSFAPELTPEHVVERSKLVEQLDALRNALHHAEGELDLVNDLIAMKGGIT
jgi:predicted DNA-binding WGR domain protein